MSHIGAAIGDDTAIMKQVLRSQDINVDEATDVQEETAATEGIQWYLALAFLMGSDRSRFGRLLEKLEKYCDEHMEGAPVVKGTTPLPAEVKRFGNKELAH